MILGKIIDEVYGSNIARDADLAYDTLIQRVTDLESKLEAWKCDLPLSLGVKGREQIVQDSTGDSELARLSTVLTLRYLSARMLLHRAVLERFLEADTPKPKRRGGSVFMESLEKTSLTLCVSSAVDLIDIHHETSKSRRRMLTTWWFSLYYGKRPDGKCLSPLSKVA